MALAVGFVLGTASTALANSLVKDIVMPFLDPILPGASWKTAVAHVGKINIAYGSFIAELLNFIVIALVIFLIVHKLLKFESAKK